MASVYDSHVLLPSYVAITRLFSEPRSDGAIWIHDVHHPARQSGQSRCFPLHLDKWYWLNGLSIRTDCHFEWLAVMYELFSSYAEFE